jgi:hypothetical protein
VTALGLASVPAAVMVIGTVRTLGVMTETFVVIIPRIPSAGFSVLAFSFPPDLSVAVWFWQPPRARMDSTAKMGRKRLL